MLRVVFDNVTAGNPVYFHCASGADRTGTLACVIEALLGMSQSDIDKEYELTCFCTGTDTAANARRRNESDWQGLIAAINAKTGSTFRDKAVNFCAELGFTADEINAFRAAMINGTPQTVTPAISNYNVSKTLINVICSNNAVSATQYQPFEANLLPNDGYVINSVTVTMGGVNITSQAFSGTKTVLNRKISYVLTNCTSTVNRKTVIDGQMYYTEIVAANGYTLENATVSITMGGVNVSTYYSNGKIEIPRVTGDIVITVSAVEQAQGNLLTMNDGHINNRLSSSGGGIASSVANGYFVSDYFSFNYASATGIRIENGALHIGNLGSLSAYGQCAFALYGDKPSAGSEPAFIGWWYISRTSNANCILFSADNNDLVCSDIATNIGTPVAGTAPSDFNSVKYIRVCLALNNASSAIGSTFDVTGSNLAIYAE